MSDDGAVLFAGESAATLLDRDPDALLGTDFGDLLAPDSAAVLRDVQAAATRGGRGGQPTDTRYRLAVPDGEGGPDRWFAARSQYIAIENDLRGTLLLFHDITATVRTEQEHRRDAQYLNHLARYNAMGDMAMAIAHEVSQPIAAAHNFLAGVRGLMATGADPTWGLDNATRQLDRAALILKSLREYVVRLEESRQSADLNDLVTDCAYFVNLRAQQHEVTLHWDHTPDPLPVHCEKVLIGQVVMNLAFNAIEEMARWPEDQRTVTIGTRLRDGWAEVAVRDRGQGLPGPHRDRIFDGAFTSKGNGHGIGLALSHRIITRHGGEIEAGANPPRGATFRFRLPPATEGHPMTHTLNEIPRANPRTTAFAHLLETVAERRQEFENLRHIPRDAIAEFKKAGLYRAAAPRRFGGEPLPPAEFLHLVERISEVDGSAGWVASFGSALTYLAALPLDTQAELYANGPDVVFAGGLFPLQPAESTPGGHRVSGHWKFASGCKGADILGVGIKTGDDRTGRPRTALLRPDQVEIVENWNVLGMRGTGSHDLAVHGVDVPHEWTFLRGGEPTVDEPLYRYPSVPYAAQVLAVVGLGVARAALDQVITEGGRAGYTGGPVAADRATYRIAVGQAEARLRSVRAFFYEATEEVWETVVRGDAPSAHQASLLRLASAHLAKVSFEVVRSTYQPAGIRAIADGSPMQRYLRDASVVPLHAFLQEGMYDGAGAVLMGANPFPGYL
ncbi:hypothetical protein GCM10010329_44710 [Streptomyces spiroverticillatus]|uniref:histidine kinase n=1 Tax=Streptomyces finlayi TaxID=67296 RepID=A0A919CAZ7_9ACTN|nr:ATP-binding protein [Streptomyces finlayi]GHA16782.1 hypothetical protein GCM10010329_44710 [Streptomyces spiroverticillatus]GHC98932.1 hypothetical protein GCM10010334_41890 [Streptomyces finlayi]